jgi:hypothetical protein
MDMSSGQINDIHETKVQKDKRDTQDTGANWLRHRANTQAATIDTMILEGEYTIEQIAARLNEREAKKYLLSRRIRRVKDHIAHLQDGVGDSRGKSHGMKPHDLKVRADSAGKLSFHFE